MTGQYGLSRKMTAKEALPEGAHVDENGCPSHLRVVEVCSRLRVGRTEVARLCERGLLRKVMGKDGWRVFFLASEVEKLAAERYDNRPTRQPGVAKPGTKKSPGPHGGKLAAKVFALLDDGANLSRVVREARITPERARVLWKEWKTSFQQGEANEKALEVARREREAQREHDKDMFKRAQLRASARVARRASGTQREDREDVRRDEPGDDQRGAA